MTQQNRSRNCCEADKQSPIRVPSLLPPSFRTYGPRHPSRSTECRAVPCRSRLDMPAAVGPRGAREHTRVTPHGWLGLQLCRGCSESGFIRSFLVDARPLLEVLRWRCSRGCSCAHADSRIRFCSIQEIFWPRCIEFLEFSCFRVLVRGGWSVVRRHDHAAAPHVLL